MKKINNNGFVLAETLIVTVFLMVLFTMVYSNFYPLIGEYEKREGYDDIDGKYAAYWIKKLVESAAFQPSNTKKEFMQQYGYMRFECSDIQSVDNQRDICINLVNSFSNYYPLTNIFVSLLNRIDIVNLIIYFTLPIVLIHDKPI